MLHDELAASLAVHLSNPKHREPQVCWLNMKLRSGRPDVFAITPSFNLNKTRPTTYEIKVSRSDFLADVRAAKHRQYEKMSQYVYFAAPRGLLSEDEIPDGCGLIEYYSADVDKERPISGGKAVMKWTVKAGWHVTKFPKICHGELSLRDWMKMAFSQQKAFAPSYPQMEAAE